MRLNYDVLIAIMHSFPNIETERRLFFYLVKTCRALYHNGIPLLLQGLVRINHGTPQQLRSFIDFTCYDYDRRTQSLHSLSESVWRPTDASWDTSCDTDLYKAHCILNYTLIKLISQLPHLRHLEITDFWIGSSPFAWLLTLSQ